MTFVARTIRGARLMEAYLDAGLPDGVLQRKTRATLGVETRAAAQHDVRG